MSSLCMPLNSIGIGRYAEVSNVEGGELMGKKLMEMGVNKGAVIEVVRNDAGPLIIRVGESRLVLGRGMAQKVMVREV
ncbi:ferrous iron transport protein A [Clostridium sp. CX1]|uniref:Ferrous iron transport protein A n=1 Tax=Clostridium tanneri TaxID=3037988 RepID=A0ABU4JW73_9CLOT|nr:MULTISPECIES: ferrous iron transport protein A [unclassified Clostridium]MCT8976783.1 ferrous iron transport protein A [Clostridium sp. CX1]MDW8802400.1 ferrous iron transport protein A [Clostridium sp. A1-XYC3]